MNALPAWIAQHFAGDGVTLAAQTPADTLHETTAVVGAGCDFPNGELPVVHYRFSFPSRGEAMGAISRFVVTDRRLFGRVRTTNYPEAVFDIPFAHVAGLRLDKRMLGSTLYVQLGAGEVRVPLVTERIHTFLQSLAQVPYDQRGGVAATPVAVTDGDPTGAMAASHQLHARDLRPQTLLRLIHQRAISEPDTAVHGHALVKRVMLFDRALRYGRGMQQGFWLSVLPPTALASLCNAMLGGAQRHWIDGGYMFGDFLPGAAPSSGVGGAAVTALGIASLLVTGVGWISMPGVRAPTLRGLRAVVGAHELGSGLQLLGSDGATMQPLSVFQHEGVAAIFDALARIESRVLLGWALLGVERDPDAIAAMPPDAFAPIAERALGGAVDLRPFFARG